MVMLRPGWHSSHIAEPSVCGIGASPRCFTAISRSDENMKNIHKIEQQVETTQVQTALTRLDIRAAEQVEVPEYLTAGACSLAPFPHKPRPVMESSSVTIIHEKGIFILTSLPIAPSLPYQSPFIAPSVGRKLTPAAWEADVV